LSSSNIINRMSEKPELTNEEQEILTKLYDQHMTQFIAEFQAIEKSVAETGSGLLSLLHRVETLCYWINLAPVYSTDQVPTFEQHALVLIARKQVTELSTGLDESSKKAIHKLIMRKLANQIRKRVNGHHDLKLRHPEVVTDEETAKFCFMQASMVKRAEYILGTKFEEDLF
jgi:hypothetical protein